ncbi:hypothetical protein BC937DRAFT_88232 [Endogone sp. FLAS-F59071]|nr:hypothetical protein BC937DRAFT_88232 [Endogone sp. FLAS-F59071]|eukprot:RUS22626.1 hypothetical protein BC937DRAFT_88232 [Endogone sp. FLAS-F59071]
MATANADDPAPTVSSEPRPEENIQAIKERVINTNKLLKIFKTKEQELAQAKNDITNIQTQLSACNTQLSLSIKELNFFKVDSEKSHKEVTRLAQLLAARENELSEVKSDAENCKSELESTRTKMENAQVKLRSVEMLKAQLEAELQENTPSKTNADKMKKEMAKLQKDLDAKDAACKAVSKELAELKAERKEDNSKARLADKEKFKAEKEKFKAEKEELQAEVKTLQTDKENLEQKIMELELDHTLTRDALDNSKQDLDKLQRELNEWKGTNPPSDEIQQLRDQVRKLEDEKRQAHQHAERLDQQVEELRASDGAHYSVLAKELEVSKAMIAKLKEDQRQKSMITAVTSIPRDDYLDIIQAELDAANNLIDKQKSEIDALRRTRISSGRGEEIEILKVKIELLSQENEHLVKAKRVLQDTYTDQLIQIAELKETVRQAVLSPSGKAREFPLLSESSVGNYHLSASSPSVSVSKSLPISRQRVTTFASPTRATESAKNPTEQTRAQNKDHDVLEEVQPPASPVPSVKSKRTRRTKAEIEEDKKAKEVTAREKAEAAKRKKTEEAAKESVKRTRRKTAEAVFPVPAIINHSKYIADKFKDLTTNPKSVFAMVGDLEIFATTKTELLFSALEDYLHMFTTPVNLLDNPGATGMRRLVAEGHPVLDVPTCLRENEADLILFLWALANKFPQTQLLESILNWATETIFLNVSKMKDMEYAYNVCRIFVIVCRAVGALQRVRVFCFDLMRESVESSYFLSMFSNVAAMWPDVLKYPVVEGSMLSVSENGQSLMLRTFESIFSGLYDDYEHNTMTQQLYSTLESCCGWNKPQNAPYLDDIIEEMISVLRLPEFHSLASTEANQDYRFNLVKSLELAAYYYGNWEHIYEQIISNVLWPLMKDNHLVDMSLQIIGVLGRSGLFEEEEKAGIQALRQKMEDVLDLGHDVSQADFVLQIHAARSLLLLANGELKHVMSLFRWYREMRENKQG